MANPLALAWDLIARDNASPTFLRVSAAADKAAASTEAAAAKTEASSRRIGAALKTAAVVGVAGVAALGIESLKMAANFQTSTTRLVTSANESQKNLKMVQRGILDLSGQVGDSAEELAKAAYKIESGGQHGAAALETLKAAAQGAKAENADLTTVADALTSVLQDYHRKASAAADVTSKLVAATASGKMTFEELAGSLSAILPLASANHVSLNDILGDLASMTIHGMSAEQASQNLADALRHLAAPTAMQSKELAALGISATQLSASLGQKGVYGSIQMVAAAIQQRLGAGTQQIVLDLNTALAKLPPNVRKLGDQILSGTISLGDYRKAMKALPAEQAVAAQSFMALVSSTHQLGTQTKSGAEVYQSYSGALRQALGDATGMNVALMLTGENSKTTETAIGNVSKATADAHGNVKGWDEIQSTFNVRLQQFGQTLESDTIRLGQRLLPAATDFVSMLNRDAIPAIEHTASGLATAGHWFGQLPGPIKSTALALGGLALANKIGLFAGLNAVTGKVAGTFTAAAGSAGRFGEQMAVQQRLAQMEAAAIGEVDAALGGLSGTANAAAGSLTRVQLMMRGWDTTLAATVVEEDAAAASTGRLAAAYGVLSVRAGAAGAGLAKGLGSAVSLIGGPWGAAILTATAAYMSFSSVQQKSADQTEKWVEALKKGGDAATQASAQIQAASRNVDTSNFGYKFLTTSNSLIGSLQQLTPGVAQASTVLREHAKAAENAQRAYKDWYGSLSVVDQKQQDLNQATANLQSVLRTHAANSLAVTEAENKVAIAQQDVTYWTKLMGDATQTAAQKAQALSQAELDLAGNSVAVKQSYDEFIVSLQQYKKDAVDPTLKGTAQLAVEQDSLNQSALGVAQAAGTAGEAWAEANKVTDTATAGQYAQLVALQKVQQAMGTNTPAAVTTLIQSLAASVAQGHLTQKQMDAITTAVDGIPGQKNVNVTADTSNAQRTIDGFLKSYRNVQYTGSAIVVNGRVVANAAGNLLPMSATEATVVRPGALRVIGDNPVADEAFIPLNNSARSLSILSQAASRMGRAVVPMAGGGISDLFPVQPSAGMLASARSAANFAPGGNTNIPGGRSAIAAQVQAIAAQRGWGSGAEWAALVSVINRESGFNPNAANPTSSARGLFQKMTSIYGPVESTVTGQTNWGLNYIGGRYGDPIGAARHEAQFGWYDGGGYLPPGLSLAMNGTGKPERVRTASQEASLNRPLVIKMYDADNHLIGTMRGVAQQEADHALGQVHDAVHYAGS